MKKEATEVKMQKYLDKFGREIEEHDILKIFHFTAVARRQKCYMYKQACFVKDLKGVPHQAFKHLNGTDNYYYAPRKSSIDLKLENGKNANELSERFVNGHIVLLEYEIVQSKNYEKLWSKKTYYERG